MNDNVLTLVDVHHAYGLQWVLGGISLAVGRREFVAVVGPSGCGKTTLLKVLAGSLTATTGTVARSGRVRVVYQEDGLLPWLTVGQNVALGLRDVAGQAERARQTAEMLSLVGAAEFAGAYPYQLSGGMRQRAELARALAGGTDLLLLDEPFSALDYLTRAHMRGELAHLVEVRRCAAVLVTHHLEEAAELADRILVVSGRPARIRREIVVPVPRPRGPGAPGVAAAVRGMEDEFTVRVRTA